MNIFLLFLLVIRFSGIPVNGGPKFNYCVKGYYPVCMASWVV